LKLPDEESSSAFTDKSMDRVIGLFINSDDSDSGDNAIEELEISTDIDKDKGERVYSEDYSEFQSQTYNQKPKRLTQIPSKESSDDSSLEDL